MQIFSSPAENHEEIIFHSSILTSPKAPVTSELEVEESQYLCVNYWAQETIFWLNILS